MHPCPRNDTGHRILAASVVRFTIDELGTRKGVAMFVDGKRQLVPYVCDCRASYGGGRKQ